MRKRHGVSVPSASDRFDFFEVGHGIGMSAEVDVLSLHILHLAGKVQNTNARVFQCPLDKTPKRRRFRLLHQATSLPFYM